MTETSVPGDTQPQPEVPRSWGCLSLLALISLAFVPAVLLIRNFAVPWRLILWGAAMWGVAVAVKKPLALQLYKALGKTGRQVYVSACQGLLSAGLELGFAALYLYRVEGADIYSVLGFGVGAGSAEVAYVLALGVVAKPDPAQVAEWEVGARRSLCVRYQVPIERFFALLGHVGSRGLLYVGLSVAMPGAAALILVALVLFTAIDGVATYGHLRGRNWSDPATCRAAHSFFAATSLLEFALFLTAFHFNWPLT